MNTPYIAPFPPSISSEPWAYGLALFSDLLVSAIALALFIGLLFEGHRKHEAVALIRTTAGKKQDKYPFFSVLRVRRFITMGFLLTLILRAAPDAAWMLCWQEATKGTMDFLFVIDWWGDVLALIPAVGSVALLAWSLQAIDQVLAEVSNIALARPKWEQARQYVYIVGVVMFLAVGVTLGKAVGAA